MATFVDITGDVAIDVDSRRAFPLVITGPPEAEGSTCGLYFAGEEGADGYVEQISYGPYVATAITLGPNDWDTGAIAFTDGTTVNQAIKALNDALLDVASATDGTELALGDEVATDGSSLWDDGAVALTPTTPISVAISELNKYVEENSGGAADGFHLPLGDVETEGDGSWSPGAVPFTNDMKVSEGMDRLNEVLAKLVPSQPPQFPSGTLSVSNPAGTSARLASGVTDNAGSSGLTAGASVTRITAAGVSSNIFNDIGPGEAGTVRLYVNNVVVGSKALTGTGDNGTYNGLIIGDQKDYPVSTPGFWRSIDVSVTGAAALQGINSFKIEHTQAGVTDSVFFVRDNMVNTPIVSGGGVTEASAGTYAYSSSVPHYGTGGTLNISASYSNLSGETYYGGSDPFVISGTNGIFSAVTVTYAGLGISTPIARQTTAATAITGQVISVDGNVHNSGVVQGTARNVNGTSAATTLASKTVLVKRGSAGARIDEMSIPVTGLGTNPNGNNAVRVSLGSGDKPSGVAGAWDSAATLPIYEATVVGGVIKHDQTNYSNGYLPSGPDFSVGRSDPQYFTVAFNRTALSAFKINITGNYAGVFVKLPGVSDAQPNGGGWWDATQPYDGAGVPGEVGDPNAGCALGTVMNGGSGTFQITFGTASSTSATDKQILVRFKLTAGQSITALSYTN